MNKKVGGVSSEYNTSRRYSTGEGSLLLVEGWAKSWPRRFCNFNTTRLLCALALAVGLPVSS